ncbi:hypothetical protein Pint_09568 [Pistacia integerrima]|uniref:Uncharacterized protein n=1 Tax=Pistacia integerrima TaxID=434235 RepID=A0ACC0XLG5_9ROSI|nr:hypothetical protein Pint_09568 [Pistacia integerrima]
MSIPRTNLFIGIFIFFTRSKISFWRCMIAICNIFRFLSSIYSANWGVSLSISLTISTIPLSVARNNAIGSLTISCF